MKRYLFAILVFISLGLHSQKTTFTATGPKAVEIGETFQITYSVNAQGNKFSGPTFSDFDYLGGPFTSSSSSMQIINGNMTQSVNQSYTYRLRANKKGTFTIPAATITANGKQLKSNTLTIQVVDGTTPSPTTSTPNQNTPSASVDVGDGLIFGRTSINKKQLYVGEPILVTQKIYSEKPITNVQNYKEPTYTGFWKEQIDIGELKLEREALGNKVYNSVTLQKMILFAQKAGKLEIGSFDLDAQIRVTKTRKPRDQWELWMYGNQVVANEDIPVKVNSPKIFVDVKPLPETGKPANFSGLVGKFTMSAKIDRNTLEMNDAITMSIEVTGSGNIDLLSIPNPEFPTDFEVYDPKTTVSAETTVAGVRGGKTYEYLIIPRNEGSFVIPPIKVSYFDTELKKYIELKSDSFLISVGKGHSLTNTSSPTVNQNQVKLLSNDIRFIKTKTSLWKPIKYHYFNSLGHLILVLIIPILFTFLFLFRKKQTIRQSDIVSLKNKRATKVAKLRLKKADKLLKANDNSGFYEEISKALWGYLSDKFNLPLSTLSMDNVREKLNPRLDTTQIDRIVNILNDCEFARFAPNSDFYQPQELYTLTLEIISTIEKSFKS
ncbi:MAG: protein BatD [Bacteroidales bacterium]|nr:protein BatD [Bacteroidales bacterium]